MTKFVSKNGYYHVGISHFDNEKRIVRHLYIHCLVAYQKFKDIYSENPLMEVRHLDGNSLNNTWDNISIGSKQENMLDKDSVIRRSAAVKAASFTRKFTDEEVLAIKQDRALGLSYKELSIKWNACKSTFSYILSPTAKRQASYK